MRTPPPRPHRGAGAPGSRPQRTHAKPSGVRVRDHVKFTEALARWRPGGDRREGPDDRSDPQHPADTGGTARRGFRPPAVLAPASPPPTACAPPPDDVVQAAERLLQSMQLGVVGPTPTARLRLRDAGGAVIDVRLTAGDDGVHVSLETTRPERARRLGRAIRREMDARGVPLEALELA